MAAETLTATRAAATVPVPDNALAGLLHAHWGSYAIAANVEDGDIFEMHYVPDGATVLDGVVRGDDMDTGTEALDIDVGWAANQTDLADPDGFGNLGIWTGDAVAAIKPEAYNYFPFGGVLKDGVKTFTAAGGKTMIQLEANVAAATFAAGDVTVTTYYTT
jgi:hypothetical protein